MNKIIHNTRLFENSLVIAVSFFILIMAMFFHETLYGVFGEQNYLSIHLIMEFFVITIAFSIATQSWMVLPHTLSSKRLWIGALFFAIGFLEIAHTVTFKGMPYFLSESSAQRATWFFIAGRLTEVIGILAIVTMKDRLVSPQKRWVAYSLALLYSFLWAILIFPNADLLPELVKEGVGTTALKNNLQYGGMIIKLLVIYFVIVKFRPNQVFNFMLIVASVYLIMADYFFTTYKSVYDINNFIGHLFQLAGFYFLQRAAYHTSVEETFEKQKIAEEQLKQNERFLQTITSHMGEGLIVVDEIGNLSYMNLEAERLLEWSQNELLGKNICNVIHRMKDGEPPPFENCLAVNPSMMREVAWTKEDSFIRKNGLPFPVAYVTTPYLESGQVKGSIMVFRDISQQIKDQEMIHYMAFHDDLTKLPNLRLFKEKLTEIVQLQTDKKAAIFVLDIDRFKNINEAFGHSFGDLILQGIASRLTEQIEHNMFLSKLPGDEFAIILSSAMDEDEIITVVERIQNCLKEPLQAQQMLLNVTTSVGVALIPGHGETTEDLLQHANMALMEAQQQNKSFEFYQPSMNGKALERLVFENDLYQALANNELHLVYQPQIDINTGQIVGLEALVRWQHPKYGWISPAKFIPLAEETGLIVPIGEWVLRTAGRQVKQWHEQGLPLFVIAVNLSIRQFYQQNLVELVQDILQETELLPQFLELEITESMMTNVDHAMKTLKSLKALGVHIAIDDFGTGYSSLSYLKHLPFDRLKIDQSFVRDLLNNEGDSTIVSTIISLARHLNLQVIAEGVETSSQMEVLKNLQCHQAQGYLFSPPLAPDEIFLEFEQLQQRAQEKVGRG